MNKVSLSGEPEMNLYDIDNDNLITEDDVKRFKFENDFENDKNPLKNLLNIEKKIDHKIQFEEFVDYDLIDQANEMDDEFMNFEDQSKLRNNDKDLALGKRTYSEAFNNNFKFEEEMKIQEEHTNNLPLKIRN